MKYKIIFVFFCFCFLFNKTNASLVECSKNHSNIIQGGIIDEKIVKKIRINMTKKQILYIIGNPILINMFNQDEYYYIFYKINNRKIVKQSLILYFKNNYLIKLVYKI